MYAMIIGPVALSALPPPEAVTATGGGRAITERTAIDSRIITTRPAPPSARRITIQAPGGYGITAADALAIAAIGDAPFTLTLAGYDPAGSWSGCVFEEPPRLEPLPGAPGWRSYSLTIYAPQGAS